MRAWKLTPEQRAGLLEFARQLVRTPSFPGEEGVVAERIVQEMRRLNYDEVTVDAAGNVLGRIGPAEGPGLMLNSHMDTIEATASETWKIDPFGAEVRDGRLYGLGSCDMKGGLSAMVHGAALVKARGTKLKGPIWVACVGLEEPAEGTCTRSLFEESRVHPQWVVIGEPSKLDVVRAQRGHLEMSVVVKGRSAHSSAPELGENAIYAAARLIFGLEILAEQLMDDPFLGPGVLAVTRIQSWAAGRNAIPERCELLLDRRLTAGETEAMAMLEIQRVIAREGINAEVRVIEEDVQSYTGKRYRVRRYSPPWALDERHSLVQAMVQATRAAGLRSGITRWHFATEGAYTAGVAGVPTVGFGPGDPALPHTVNEYVEVEQIYSAAEVYAALATHLLGEDAT